MSSSGDWQDRIPDLPPRGPGSTGRLASARRSRNYPHTPGSQDWDGYDAVGEEPEQLKSLLRDVRRELQEERRRRQEVELECEKLRRRVLHLEVSCADRQILLCRVFCCVCFDHLLCFAQTHEYDALSPDPDAIPQPKPQYNLKEVKEQGAKVVHIQKRFREDSIANNPQNTEEEFASDDSNGGDAGNRNYATTLTQQKARAKRLLRALKACQAERDNLSKQVNVDARVKEFLDSQVSDLELKLKALQKENNDLVTQVEADSRMKEFLADQWEASRLELEEVTENLQAISAERDSIAMQVEADQRIKEYLSEQWERSESMRREAESQNSNDMQLFGHSRRQAANGARRRRNEPSMGRYA